MILTADKAFGIPNWLLPPLMNNHGNYIISLGNLCRWLAQQAESIGVEVYAGFPGAEILYDTRENGGAVLGVVRSDGGVQPHVGLVFPPTTPKRALKTRYPGFGPPKAEVDGNVL